MTERSYNQTFCVAGAMIEKDGKILLVKEGGNFVDTGKWNRPAGWVDLGEDPIAAAMREAKEETGLDFKPTALLGVYSLVRKDREKALGYSPHVIKFIFKGEITGGTLIESNEEIQEIRWFTREEINALDPHQLRDADLVKEIDDYFAGVSHPLALIHHTFQQ